MNWHEYVMQTGKSPAWPYEVDYGKEHVLEADVLIVGGGVAGERAAIEARKYGATVIVADRGDSSRSGRGGAGVDHWLNAVTNPCSTVTPEEFTDTAMHVSGGYTNGIARYISAKEGWDTLLEAEEMGVQIRDTEGEFKGASFRDEETGLLFAYDNKARHMLRIYGARIKPCVDREMKRRGVRVENRICITAFLTENGKQGARVIGALGVNSRTGEFYIFKAKAVVVATGGASRVWNFAPEITESNSMMDLNLAGLGWVAGIKAGAEFCMMDHVIRDIKPGFGYAPYSMGNTGNTYYGTKIVDADGKEVQMVNCAGKEVSIEDTMLPGNKDKFTLGVGIGLFGLSVDNSYNESVVDPKLPDKIRSGEYKLPLYADFPGMDEKNRRAVFGLMVGHEGKTMASVYKNYTQWGFDPDKDMLQCPVYGIDSYKGGIFWGNMQSTPQSIRILGGQGGYLTDWRLMTNLPGLFAAGAPCLFGNGNHGESHTTGRYAGRQAALFAQMHDAVEPDRAQIDAEKAWCYEPVTRPGGDMGWKELNYASARIMQDYLGPCLTDEVMDLGIARLNSLEESEGHRTYAANPHELVRVIESRAILALDKFLLETAKARKSSNKVLNFNRVDDPADDPAWHVFLPIHMEGDKAVSRKMSCTYYKEGEYAESYEENYRRYCGLKEGEHD